MKNTKRLLAVLIVLSMVFGFSAINASAADASYIGVGSYVSFGSYMGSPIFWQAINSDSNGLLLFSEKIISLKAFDAADGAFDIGSNAWTGSNLNDWLNGDGPVSFSGTAPQTPVINGGNNEYAGEAGFLSGFTATEKQQISTVSMSTVAPTAALAASGTELFSYIPDILSASANFQSAYKTAPAAAKVFLLDIDQFALYVKNAGFELAKQPTDTAVVASDYKSASLAAEKPWRYWLRTPRCNASGGLVRTNDFGTSIGSEQPFEGTVGVAPALYLKLSAPVVSGSGTKADPFVVAGGSFRFTDLAGYEYASGSILALADRGVVNGTGGGNFSPSNNVTRADFIVMLMRALGHQGPGISSFNDVSKDAYYYDAVSGAKLRGYINGGGNGNFNPSEPVTKQDMYVITARALSIDSGKKMLYAPDALSGFTDAYVLSGYAQGPIAWLSSLGIMPSSGLIEPTKNATRADCAVFIFRLACSLKRV